MRGLPRPLLLSVRNTFRRTGRLALTLATLSLGGAIFISIFGLRSTLNSALERTFGYTLADVNVNLASPQRIEQLAAFLRDVPGVVVLEGWSFAQAQVLDAGGEGGLDVQIIAPPAASELIQPSLIAGRWLLPADQNALVVGNHYLKLRPSTQVGDRVQLRIDQREYAFQIVGIYEMAGSPNVPMVFANYEYLACVTNRTGLVSSLRIVADRGDAARQVEVQRALEARLHELGLPASVQTGYQTTGQQSRPARILIALLLAMAVLIALVGGLGLTGAMSLNVLERTREIGVLRAVGALSRDVFGIVLAEGMCIRPGELDARRALAAAHPPARPGGGYGLAELAAAVRFLPGRSVAVAGGRAAALRPGEPAPGAQRGAPDGARRLAYE